MTYGWFLGLCNFLIYFLYITTIIETNLLQPKQIKHLLRIEKGVNNSGYMSYSLSTAKSISKHRQKLHTNELILYLLEQTPLLPLVGPARVVFRKV